MEEEVPGSGPRIKEIIGLIGLIGQMRQIGPIRQMRPIGLIRLMSLIRPILKKRNKFGFNNTELINLVLIMFPAGRH